MQFKKVWNWWEFFYDSSFHHIFESEILGFPFSTNNSKWKWSEMWKFQLKKIVGNLLNALKIVHELNGHLEIFNRPHCRKF